MKYVMYIQSTVNVICMYMQSAYFEIQYNKIQKIVRKYFETITLGHLK